MNIWLASRQFRTFATPFTTDNFGPDVFEMIRNFVRISKVNFDLLRVDESRLA